MNTFIKKDYWSIILQVSACNQLYNQQVAINKTPFRKSTSLKKIFQSSVCILTFPEFVLVCIFATSVFDGEGKAGLWPSKTHFRSCDG